MTGNDEQHIELLRKFYGPDLAGLTLRQDRAVQRYARDAFDAGQIEGEKQAHAVLVRPDPGVALPRNRGVDLAIELVASVATLGGMWVGSTTVLGAELYLVGTAAWMAISWRKSLHGIWPLNIGAAAVSLWNLWAALA